MHASYDTVGITRISVKTEVAIREGKIDRDKPLRQKTAKSPSNSRAHTLEVGAKRDHNVLRWPAQRSRAACPGIEIVHERGFGACGFRRRQWRGHDKDDKPPRGYFATGSTRPLFRADQT